MLGAIPPVATDSGPNGLNACVRYSTLNVPQIEIAIEHGAELNSCDADFSRFSGLRWVNPLDGR